MIHFSEDDPKAKSGQSGTFTFTEVPPGTYVLDLSLPGFLVALATGEQGEVVVLKVAAGETLDVGVIRVEQ